MPSILRRFRYDDETGETVTYAVNDETGEPSSALSGYKENSRAYIVGTTKHYTKFPKGYNTRTRKFKSLKENIIQGSNTMSFRLLLIPTVLIFPGLLCVCLTIMEIYLHVKCHRKNKDLKMKCMYYQSPFHMVTRIFCGSCREIDSASKVGQMQDKRRFHHAYLRRIAI